MADATPYDVQRFFHVNVNCSDFDRSLAFYRLLGFDIVVDFEAQPGPARTMGELGFGPILGLPDDCDGRAALLALDDDPKSTRLDLIEWRSPGVPSVPRRNLAQPGLARICLKTKNTDALHQKLVEAGHRPYTAPISVSMGGSRLKVFCCEDPDGVVVEFMEFLGQDAST